MFATTTDSECLRFDWLIYFRAFIVHLMCATIRPAVISGLEEKKKKKARQGNPTTNSSNTMMLECLCITSNYGAREYNQIQQCTVAPARKREKKKLS